MLKILIVDDDKEKIRRVLGTAYGVHGVDERNVDIAYTAYDARHLLRQHTYDLMVLDLALPERADVAASAESGLALLREICDRQGYNRPKQIVGLTGFSEVLERAEPLFEQQLWPVIYYDAASTEWSQQLERKIRYVLLALENKPLVEYGCHLCVLTALPVPEYSAVIDIPWGWREFQPDNEVSVFHEGSFENGGAIRRVVAGCAPRVGMASAAVHATKMIAAFRPRYLAMTGISAGFRGQCNMGDVLVADPTWDYGSGKWALKGGKAIFEMAPHQISLQQGIRSRLQSMSRQQDIFDEIRNAWRATKPDTALRMIIGPLASGSAVRADGGAYGDVRAQHRKAVGTEMEAYGLMAAANDAPVPEVSGFVMKSVCDFADEMKSDDYQAYAAYTSAASLQKFAERFLPM